ncbi:MAG: putative membrane protein, partial [Oceanospirillaceae bacterium]
MDTSEVAHQAYITNDAVVLGLLVAILAFVFYTSSKKEGFWSKFYTYVPALLLCYFLPSLLNTFGIIDGHESNLYFVASRYLLPASLVLLTLSIDLKGIIRLGPKAIIMFLTGTISVIIGGPIAILVVSTFAPDVVGGAGPEAVWRGLSTVAGSWIGGGANQTAMKEVFQPSDDLFSAMIAVDVICANVWMAVILFGVGYSDKIDKFFKADTTAIEDLKKSVSEYQSQVRRIPNLTDLIMIIAIGMGVTAFSHFCADLIAPAIKEHAPELGKFSLTSGFFWIV